MCDLLDGSTLPVLDLGAGAGVLTNELLRRGRRVTAVELDPWWANVLRRRFGTAVRVVQDDMLRFRFPREPYNVISSVPYSITTVVLRTLFQQDAWRLAVLMMQWEVARKRSGATLLTACWWPWYESTLIERVPARAFRPIPRVDSGLLRVDRRPAPLLPAAVKPEYQRFVSAVFTGRGAGLAGILRHHLPRATVRRWAQEHSVDLSGLPTDLTATQWVALYQAVSR